MYTSGQLRSKSLLELKEIGLQLNALPDGDRRLRRNWIWAIEQAAEQAGDREPETSQIAIAPAVKNSLDVEVDPVPGAIASAAKNSPGVEAEPVSEAIESKIEPAAFRELTFSEALKICRSISEALPTKSLKELQLLRLKVLDLTARPGSNCFHGHSKHKSSWIAEIRNELTYLLQIRAIAFPPPIGLGRSIGPGCLEKSWILAIETSPPVEVDPVSELESKFGRIAYPRPAVEVEPETSQSAIVPVAENSPAVEVEKVQEPIEQAAKKPGVKGTKVAAQRQKVIELLEQKNLAELDEIAWRVNVLPEGDPQCRQNWIDALVNVDIRILQYLCRQVQVEDPVQEPIAQAVKNTLDAEVDRRQEPIENSPGVEWTDADRWNPAEFGEVFHRIEASGQLNLLEWDVSEPPDPDDYEGDMFAFWAEYDRWRLSSELEEIIHAKNDAPTGTVIGVSAPSVSSGCDFRPKYDGASCDRQDERLAGKKGDCLLEKTGLDSGDSRGTLPHQPAQLAQASVAPPQAPVAPPQAPVAPPQAPVAPPQAPVAQAAETSPGVDLKVGMLVGRQRDRQHLGKILAIYKSRRGIWRAKIQPLNKSNFVYFDCATLIEQRLLYDYEMKPGGFVLTGEIFNKARCEHFDVLSRKVRPPKPTNWTADELNSLSPFKLKQIARDMEILFIPGTAGKRSLIRAILAEQAISQEKAAAQRERETGRAIVQKRKSAPTTGKKKRVAASPLGNQLSLFDVAV